MDRIERNKLFEEKSDLIVQAIRRHWGLIRFFRLERDDVYKELAIKLLHTLEQYDADRCPTLDAYLTIHLR